MNVGVRELRQNLSVYLTRVKRGETLRVTEHRQVVAILRPADMRTPIDRLVAEGRATPATRLAVDMPRALRLKLKRPLSRILDELREDTI
jgi:antitoxin (DNA-binding transcriptional repressor) of toxin-antitoxin stability system